MKPPNPLLIVIVLVAGLLLAGHSSTKAQDADGMDTLPDFQWALPESGSPETGGAESVSPFSESTFMEAPPPPARPKPKAMVEVPESPPESPSINAGDFRDPFFPVRGMRMDAKKTLEPGVTIDGVRFFSYGESSKFIENYYRESGFSLDEVFDDVAHHEGRDECLTCHRGIEEISKNHRFSCTRCHGGRRKAVTLPEAHEGLVGNPSALEHAEKFCGKCHAGQVEAVNASSMAEAKNLINATRFAWGEQPAGDLSHSLRPNPAAQEKPLPALGQGKPVDDFLRTRCLRCHLGSEAPHRPGDYRASGCAACHMVYNNDGVSLSHDRAIQAVQRRDFENHRNLFSRAEAEKSLASRRGYPVMHKFTLAVPSVQCEHCHNNNGVGSEFEGLFGKPARPRPGHAEIDAETPVLHGREHEFLLKDIHRERGMHCIDCHGVNELKGPAAGGHANVEIRCEDCHGTQADPPKEFLLIESDPAAAGLIAVSEKNQNLRKKLKFGDSVLVTSKGTPLMNTKRQKDDWVLYSKVTGKKHIIPILKAKEPPLAHQVKRHMAAMECHACHARWAAAEWGLHAVYEARPEGAAAWRDWAFSDPSLADIIAGQGEVSAIDWLTAKSEPEGILGDRAPGAWFSLFSETGWDNLVLGKNSRGKYSILKPRYQYFITGPGGQGAAKRAEVPITAGGKPGLVLAPYVPHTTRKSVRGCESCHENPAALGLGDPARMNVTDAKAFLSALGEKNKLAPEFQLKQAITPAGEALQTPEPLRGGRFLSLEEMAKLDEKSNAYRSFRYLDLRNLNLPRLLSRGEFPYDWKHQQMEKTFDPPEKVEDLYYDAEHNRFITEPEARQETPEPLP